MNSRSAIVLRDCAVFFLHGQHAAFMIRNILHEWMNNARIFVICGVILSASTAIAADTAVTAVMVPPVRALPQSPPQGDLERQPLDCPPDLCGIHLPDDVWKRDFFQKDRPVSLNADVIAIDRSRRQVLDNRFSKTPVLATRIGDTSCLGMLKILETGSSVLRADFLSCEF